MTIVALERHEAEKTSAYTRWAVLYAGMKLGLGLAHDLGLIRIIHVEPHEKRTHWRIFVEVKKEGISFVMMRMSNRGNYSETIYSPEDLKVTDLSLIPVEEVRE